MRADPGSHARFAVASGVAVLVTAGNPTAASLRTIAVSTIPLPAGIWLLGPAIALLAGLRRRTATDSQA